VRISVVLQARGPIKPSKRAHTEIKIASSDRLLDLGRRTRQSQKKFDGITANAEPFSTAEV